VAAPVNSVLPAITGTVEVGETLTCSTGTWAGATSYAYQWLRDAVAITGSAAATHIITVDDLLCVLSCRVTATNSGDTPATTATADSAATVAVPSTIIVELGSIVAGADSYESLVNAGAYHIKRGDATWAAATAALREAALRKATTYLDGHYRKRWKGCKVRPVPQDGVTTQALEWPRYDVVISDYIFPYDEIPQRLKDACCELALRALSAPLADDITAGIRRERVDVIETEYFQGAAPGTTYQIVDQLLSDYLKPSGSADAVRG
jgi:hypothetical protein